jgi:diamine N-acetyltransferase
MLKGKKVLLRAVEREDLKRLHELRTHVDLMLLAGGDWWPASMAAMEKHFEKDLEREENHWFVIEVDGTVIGDIGLHHINRPSNCTSFGISILESDYLGKGYGREAIGLLLDYAFRIQNFRRVWLETGSNNPRAIRAYTACGFIEEGRMREHFFTDGQYVDVVMMGLMRSEWQSQKVPE